MDIFDEIMKDLIATLEDGFPKKDVIADLKELAELDKYVTICLRRNTIIDTLKIKRINELVRKHFYHGEKEEKAAAPVKTFDFGEAIQRLKNGARVARKGWNGKGMFVIHCSVDGGEDYRLSDGIAVTWRDCMYMKAADNTVVPWVASQTDILADDWYEVKKEGTNDA